MKYWYIIIICFSVFTACTNKLQQGSELRPKALVSVTSVRTGVMQHAENIAASTIYLQRSQVTAPVAGYISSVQLKLGDRVHKGQLLYTIETKERKALGQWSDNKDSLTASYGLIKIVERQQNGEFVTEGAILCSIASSNDLYFQLNVPYEEVKFVVQNTVCTITLPDGNPIQARILKPLTQVTTGVQAVPYLAQPLNHNVFLPENLVATARLITYKKNNAQLLPKQAVLSDELMQHFWIMRLVNDSIAVKVPVQTGEKNDSLIEIIQPTLTFHEKILVSGNYGLSDTAMVKVQ